MTNNDHYFKLKCAKLNELKKQLSKELKSLSEEIMSQSVSGNIPNQQNSKKSKLSPKQAIEAPVKMQHGLAHAGIGSEAQEDLLKNYSDNPNTEDSEEAQDASWQSVNSAVGNYMTQQVQKLAQSQQMRR